ncbi:50S ribosomal protein L23 [Mesomycoplasma conjunctivae]|uniref:Large ribosomal subunit protein uL23 n=1 Tax=Mesomycoplasma conjunctivae (strain ATCC 25834 / NCTC 10147 / HRC/581) TaxID=572263 RepID=C5J5T4_MESCH|nr:50S ribosomal protein L23 [Mesomycoplasma conjunctivae]CAT04823.1 50S ribosomal protein L23 [Mesomycoplasma conjunctivae]VEU65861.1 50S ribosomal protein L23 [Mesomycoplasma conjunctivae]
MNINEIIKAPILTEKTYELMSKRVYVFKVDRRTNRAEVKKAVAYIFNVEVEKVNIFNVPKKAKRLGRFNGFTSSYKKAFVTLREGFAINLYEDDAPQVEETKNVELEAKSKEKEAQNKEKAAQIEAKVAQKLAKTGGK